MKGKRIIAFALTLLMCTLICAGALAATQSATDHWVGYNSKYTFYLNENSLIRIDAADKTKTIFTRKAGINNLIYCDDKYVYLTGETEKKDFKKLSSDADHEDSMYGVIHIDIIRVDVETGKPKSLKTNLPEQTPSGDANYLYYSPDEKNIYRMKHDGTGAKKYMTVSAYYDLEENAPETLSNGNTFTDNWDNGTTKTTITRKDGTKKTISGYPVVAGNYLFSWEHRAEDDEYCYSLFRYDLNGDKRTAISSMRNRERAELVYCAGALYFVDDVIEDYELKGFIVYKLATNGKLTTFIDRSNQKNSPQGMCILPAGNWLFLYSDAENNGMWGEFYSKHKLSSNK